jgi:hypothetical protein
MSTEASQSTMERDDWLAEALREARWAISAEFCDVAGHMDVRWLWSRNGVHYFRVNWWRLRGTGFERYIWRSAFVTVAEAESGMVVRETTVSLAA